VSRGLSKSFPNPRRRKLAIFETALKTAARLP
jgi:hypothetical protein